jgi:hypothetical protein
MNNLFINLTNLLNNINKPKYILEIINSRINGKLKLINLDLIIINNKSKLNEKQKDDIELNKKQEDNIKLNKKQEDDIKLNKKQEDDIELNEEHEDDIKQEDNIELNEDNIKQEDNIKLFDNIYYNIKSNKLYLFDSNNNENKLFYIKIEDNFNSYKLKLYNMLNIELSIFDLSNLNIRFDKNKFYIIHNKYIINGSYIFEIIKLN